MKKTVFGILSFLMILVVLAAAHPSAVFAERFSGGWDEDAGYYDISNHLDEEYWERDGSFMYYTEEGFSSSVGVDVSKWNGDIDWFSLREQGVEFAIIRVGYRGYETGEMVLDERFYDYMDGASAAGLRIGLYFYSQAIDEDEAKEEALFVINSIAGYSISLPIYFDTEDVVNGQARTEIMATANYTLNAMAFCETIESQGYRAGVYASWEWIRRNLELSRLWPYEIWYASYSPTPGRDYGFDMWQYTDLGDLYGCPSWLDMNVRVYREY